MTKYMLMIVAGAVLAPLAASAQAGNADAVLRGNIQALQAAGFAGMTGMPLPRPPASASAMPRVAGTDETSEALAALSGAARESAVLIGESVRALGFDFDGDSFPASQIGKQSSADGNRYFNVTSFRGKPEIIIGEFDKAAHEVRSYLISSDGTLEAAAVTRKEAGRIVAEKIEISEAQAGCRELLEFWTRYYRENLKKP